MTTSGDGDVAGDRSAAWTETRASHETETRGTETRRGERRGAGT
ncbi:hypothetical protein [Halorubrum salinum]|nr:hypothetical protein [Halorubrum salinum]